jgi:hypothetical protein
MSGRFFAGCLSLVAIVSLLPSAANGQTKAGPRPTTASQAKTPWGDPDIQGIWNNVTATPLQRADEFKDKANLTADEAAAFAKRVTDRQVENDAKPIEQQAAGSRTGYSPIVWFETSNKLSDNRTSLLVFPEGGRLPPLTPEAQALVAKQVESRKVSPADRPEDRGAYERCITRGLPGAMMPGFYNHNYQILQTPGYVVILVEMIHDARISPVDGRPHFNSGIKQWLGDSRGHWEGNTLVVETTNLRDIDLRTTTVFGTTEKGKVIERFTRLGPDEMDYHVTVEDPTYYTQNWTASIPMSKVKGPLFEYACHEGNYGLPNILAGHRKEEADAAGAAKVSGVATDQR